MNWHALTISAAASSRTAFAMSLPTYLLTLVAVCLIIGSSLGAETRSSRTLENERAVSLRPGDIVLPTGQLGFLAHNAAEEPLLVLLCIGSLTADDLRAAEQQCTTAIKLNGQDPAPHKLRGEAYLFEKRFEEARFDFKEAIALDPRDPENHGGYAEALRGQGDFDRAILQFGIAIRLNPKDERMWNARCWTRGVFGRELARALTDCNTALRLDPRHPAIRDSRGLIYLRMGRYALAERDFAAALRADPDIATALYERGVVRLRRGDLKGALGDIFRARRLVPDIDDVFFWSPLLPNHCVQRITRNCWLIKGTPPSREAPVPANSKTTIVGDISAPHFDAKWLFP